MEINKNNNSFVLSKISQEEEEGNINFTDLNDDINKLDLLIYSNLYHFFNYDVGD